VGVFKSEAVNKGHTVVSNSPSHVTLMKNMRYFQTKAEKLISSTVTRYRTLSCLHIQVLLEKEISLLILFPEEILPHYAKSK
jgi:arsenate reductase-like glutaredoxin family protein